MPTSFKTLTWDHTSKKKGTTSKGKPTLLITKIPIC